MRTTLRAPYSCKFFIQSGRPAHPSSRSNLITNPTVGFVIERVIEEHPEAKIRGVLKASGLESEIL